MQIYLFNYKIYKFTKAKILWTLISFKLLNQMDFQILGEKNSFGQKMEVVGGLLKKPGDPTKKLHNKNVSVPSKKIR